VENFKKVLEEINSIVDKDLILRLEKWGHLRKRVSDGTIIQRYSSSTCY
jgi:hypothetical protein